MNEEIDASLLLPTVGGSRASRETGEGEASTEESARQGGRPEGRTPQAGDFPMPSQGSRPDPESITNAEDTRTRAQDAYGREEQDALRGRVEDMGDMYRNEARSPEQQAGNYPYQFMNLAKQNPRGNLNRASFNSTLRYSRLADKLNNRLRYVPSPQLSIGTPGTGFQAPGGATIEKWPSITTQEMRQMRANERLDERTRQAGIDLQSRVQAYPQDLQEMRDKAALGLEGDLLRSEDSFNRNWQQALIESEYTGSVSNYYRKNLERYLVDLEVSNKTRLADYLLNTLAPWAGEWTTKNMYNGSLTTPGAQIRFTQDMLTEIWRDPTKSPEEKAVAAATMMYAMGIGPSILGAQSFNGLLTGQERALIRGYMQDFEEAAETRRRQVDRFR